MRGDRNACTTEGRGRHRGVITSDSWNNVLMYVPPKFAVNEENAWSIVEDAGAGVLVITTSEGLASVFVPVIVSDDRRTLLSHLARANPWWKSVGAGTDVLALFLTASAY